MALPLTGRHNVLNALGALAACDRCGIALEAAGAALETFALPKRRFELVAEARGIRVIADYAHHPSEIRALIDAARQAGAARIWAVFQPHRYTRTLALGADFPPAFDGVAGVILARSMRPASRRFRAVARRICWSIFFGMPAHRPNWRKTSKMPRSAWRDGGNPATGFSSSARATSKTSGRC